MRRAILNHEGPGSTAIKVPSKVRVRAFSTGHRVSTAGENQLRMAAAFGESSIVSIPSGSVKS
jgi:hypothetical protein